MSEATVPGEQDSRPQLNHRLAAIASISIPVVLVGGLLFLMISLRDGAEAAVAGFAGLLPVGVAFAAAW